ncbi:hypothetical protein P4O66_011004, partial [Electrophorus voltai]
MARTQRCVGSLDGRGRRSGAMMRGARRGTLRQLPARRRGRCQGWGGPPQEEAEGEQEQGGAQPESSTARPQRYSSESRKGSTSGKDTAKESVVELCWEHWTLPASSKAPF